MTLILNISAYLFVEIADPAQVQSWLVQVCGGYDVKGTILVAGEGLNVFLAAPPEVIANVLEQIRSDERFDNLTPKESWSQLQPFKKMRVRLKREIITMKHPQIRPIEQRAPAVSAITLKRWLDQGKDDEGLEIALLDTRNAFETEHGTFVGAVDYKIKSFSDFPNAVLQAQDQLKGKRVVTFCTGGIRCEKAGLWMQNQGIENVTQLDGGILKYFETVGQSHYQGECFVFDQRVTIDANLSQSNISKAPAKDELSKIV